MNEERNKHAKYINILAKLAADIPQGSGNARIAACVVLKGMIISFGVNEPKTHPFQIKYGKNDKSIFLHAETSAIKNALKYISSKELSRATLYVCRVKYFDYTKRVMLFGNARPCSGCFRCINTFSIGSVYYTTDNQEIECL